MNILTLDDNESINNLLACFLRSKGHVATSHTNPTNILSWLNCNECDCVILDIAMPEVDTIALISMIREKHPTLHIVIFTRLDYEEEEMTSCRKAGANAYVSKSAGHHELYNVIERIIGHQPAAPE